MEPVSGEDMARVVDDECFQHRPACAKKMKRGRTWTDHERTRHKMHCQGKVRLTQTEKAEIIRLNQAQDPEIRKSQSELAAMFGKSKSAISKILKQANMAKTNSSLIGGLQGSIELDHAGFDSDDSLSCKSNAESDSSCSVVASPDVLGSDDEFRNDASRVLWDGVKAGSEIARFKVACHHPSEEVVFRKVFIFLRRDEKGIPVGLLSELNAVLMKANGVDISSKYVLSYMDDEGDDIVVTSDHELWVGMSKLEPDATVKLRLDIVGDSHPCTFR
eukprot:767961-Hanusia_phi.AAC.1